MGETADVRSAAWIAGSGAVLSTVATRAVGKMSGKRLQISMGAFMLLGVGPLVALKQYVAQSPALAAHRLQPEEHKQLAASTLMAVGALVAVAGSCFGIGGGLVMVPVLAVPFDYQRAVLTSLLAMIPPSLVGVAMSHRAGNVRLPLLPGLLAGSVVGSVAGAAFLQLMDEQLQRTLFALIIGSLGLMQIFKK